MARLLAPKLAQELGQAVVIENKAGAGGTLGASEAAKSVADGYTLLMASPPLTIAPALYKNMLYKAEQIEPIGLIGRVPNVLLVNPKSDISTVHDLVKKAKNSPGKMNYASNGNGTSLHLSAELFKKETGTFITHIPYRGAAAAVTHPVIHKSPRGSLTPEVSTKKDGKAGFLASFDLYSCSNSWLAKLGHLRKNNLSCCFKNEKRCV